MPRQARTTAASPLLRLLDEGSAAALPDSRLVDRFVATRDPEAFAALVARHGPLVLGTCRGVLGAADADDAFQATFLVLLNRMGTFPAGPSLAGWLHRVARRVARQARREQARRRRREEATAPRDSGPEPGLERSEVVDAIRAELDRLPERYRAPIVLCDLEGLTRDQAAAALGCPAGTVGGRLARARRKLRDGLERRGVDPSAAPMAPLAPAAWRTALEAASRSAAAIAAGARPTRSVVALAAGATASWAPLKAAVALTVVACFAGGLLAAAGPSEPPAPEQAAAPAPVPPPAPGPPPFDLDDPKFAGRFAGRVVDAEDRPIAGARLYLARRPREGMPQALGLERGRTGPDGRFDFEAPDLTSAGPDLLPTRREGLLVAAADGYAPDWMPTWGESGSTFHSHFDPIKGAAMTLRLVRDVPIQGRILDPQGRPVAGARVRAQTLGIAERPALDRMLNPPTSPFDALLEPCHTRSIGPEVLPGVAPEVATDADGRFRLSGLGGERIVHLLVSAPGFEDQHLSVVTRDLPGAGDLPERRDQAPVAASFTARLRPDPTLSVSGVVRDRETGEPLAGVRVGRIWLGTHDDDRGEADAAVTGPDGRFTVRKIYPQELDRASDPAVRFRLTAVPPRGSTYLPASVAADRREGLVIECLKGAPYRLKVADEEGRPVDAEVVAFAASPNPWLASLPQGAVADGDHPAGRPIRTAPGVYEGVAAFGPGAVLVDTPSVLDLRPPSVDPKAFFAPGKSDWTEQEANTSFGDRETLILGPYWYRQDDYAAVVLVDPEPGSGRLELAATIYRDRPRDVAILDPEGKPLVGVVAERLICIHDVGGPPLRAATARITRLDPDRARRITFVHEGRKLVGTLLARGDGEAPYTATLQPWAAVTGRIVDADGRPLDRADLADVDRPKIAGEDDPGIGRFRALQTDHEGRFRVERLVPGLRYSAEAYRNHSHLGTAFKDLALRPGEVRDLGDVRMTAPPAGVR